MCPYTVLRKYKLTIAWAAKPMVKPMTKTLYLKNFGGPSGLLTFSC